MYTTEEHDYSHYDDYVDYGYGCGFDIFEGVIMIPTKTKRKKRTMKNKSIIKSHYWNSLTVIVRIHIQRRNYWCMLKKARN
ncbi:hypothetical protein K501DRAFT_284131 [Backusella circina FSU 941]|nr:hypothetical protein K501DRAFT_284131 [Backusella circina FSU 941]